MPKPTRTAQELQALIRARIDQVPELRGLPSDVDGGVRWIDNGCGPGPNWSVPQRTSRDRYSVTVARIIRELQQQFDLED